MRSSHSDMDGASACGARLGGACRKSCALMSDARLVPQRRAQLASASVSWKRAGCARGVRLAWCASVGDIASVITGGFFLNAFLAGSTIGLGIGVLVGGYLRRRAA